MFLFRGISWLAIKIYFFLICDSFNCIATLLCPVTPSITGNTSFVCHNFAEFPSGASSGFSKAALGGILAGIIAGAIALSAVATILIMKRRSRSNKTVSRRSCKSLYFSKNKLSHHVHFQPYLIDSTVHGTFVRNKIHALALHITVP